MMLPWFTSESCRCIRQSMPDAYRLVDKIYLEKIVRHGNTTFYAFICMLTKEFQMSIFCQFVSVFNIKFQHVEGETLSNFHCFECCSITFKPRPTICSKQVHLAIELGMSYISQSFDLKFWRSNLGNLSILAIATKKG